MKINQQTEPKQVAEHLISMRSPIRLDIGVFLSREGQLRRYYHAELEHSDKDKLMLWWEFECYTSSKTCRLKDLLPTIKRLPRVRSFIDGNAALPPVDLRSAHQMELVIFADCIESDWLYVIDGNHRAVAQSIRNYGFDGVSIYLITYTAMRDWAYIPKYYNEN